MRSDRRRRGSKSVSSGWRRSWSWSGSDPTGLATRAGCTVHARNRALDVDTSGVYGSLVFSIS